MSESKPGAEFPAFTIWLGFTAFIVYGAIVPFQWVPDSSAILDRLHQLIAHPLAFSNTADDLSISDVLQNVLLFMPFGAMGVLAGHPLRPARTRIAFVAAAGLALSAGVEALQLLTVDRVPSLGDVIVDTAGCILGAALAAYFRPHLLRGVVRVRSAGWVSGRELRPVVIAVALLAITSWQPFDITLELGSVVRKLRFLQADPWQFWGWRRAGTQVMLASFLAMALSSYLSVVGVRRAGLRAAALSAALVCVLEAGQVFVDSRMPGLADALLASSGVAVGAAIWVMAARIAWPGLWLGVLAVMTVGAATVQTIATPDSATTFEAVTRTVEMALLFFPLGYWVGQARASRRWAYGAGVALALVLATATSALAWWSPARHPDVALVGISLAGIILGVLVSTSET